MPKKHRTYEKKYRCDQCGKDYSYNRPCPKCKIPVTPINPEPVPDEDLGGSDEYEGMPDRETLVEGPEVDKDLTPKSRRERFNAVMDQFYGMIEDALGMFFPDDKYAPLRAEMAFSELERDQVNNFFYLVLKRWFPGFLDSLIAIGGPSKGEEGIFAIFTAAFFAGMVLLKKFRAIGKYVGRSKLGGKGYTSDLPESLNGQVPATV